MTRHRLLPFAVLAAAIAFAAAPFFSSFNGFDPNLFPIPQDAPPAQPAGYAFSIWGVIYLWLLISAVSGATRFRDAPGWHPARAPLFLSLVVGAFWLPVAGIDPITATVMIWIMLLSAIAALARTPLSDAWFFRMPVALYAGWLAAASWVSVALTGAGYGFYFNERTWAAIIVSAAALTAGIVLLRLARIVPFGVAVVWALIAVAVKGAGTDPAIAALAGFGALIVTGATIWNLIRPVARD